MILSSYELKAFLELLENELDKLEVELEIVKRRLIKCTDTGSEDLLKMKKKNREASILYFKEILESVSRKMGGD